MASGNRADSRQHRPGSDPGYFAARNQSLHVTGCSQVTTAVDAEAAAEAMAGALVSERLVACAQILGPVQSIYRWEGEVRRAHEWLIVAKTSDARLAELIARIGALHGYEVPEIVALPITAGDPSYLGWIERETTPLTPGTQ